MENREKFNVFGSFTIERRYFEDGAEFDYILEQICPDMTEDEKSKAIAITVTIIGDFVSIDYQQLPRLQPE